MAKETQAQKDTIGRVLHEFKHGELEGGGGQKVKSRRQAIAIGLSEAGASNRQSPNRTNAARAGPNGARAAAAARPSCTKRRRSAACPGDRG